MCKKLIRHSFRNFNWIKALITVIVVGALILGVGLPLFAPLGIEAFLSWASIIIVLYAVWISVQALNLTKATQRPFLTIVGEPEEPLVIGEKDNPRIIFHVKNTGNLPADRISIICALRTTVNKEVNIALSHSDSDLAPSIYFPSINVGHTFYMSREQFHELTKGEFTIRINIKYGNRVGRKDCSTIRTFMYDQLSKTPQSPKNTAHKEDWWD